MRGLIRLSLIMLLALPVTSTHATTATVTRFSPSNNRNVSFVVYTPPGYSSSTQSYPVVYCLHGIGGAPVGRSNQVVPSLDAAIVAGQVAPKIYVFPDGQTNSFYGDAFDGHKQVYSNIIGEVLPYIDANYRTIPHRNYRAIEGFSMGGFGAAMYAAKHPELFSAVVEYGGALSNWQNLVNFNNAVAVEMYNEVESNWLPYSLWDRSAASASILANQMNYMMVVGDADPQMGSNVQFRSYLNSLGVFPQWVVLPGVDHNGASYAAEGTGMRFLDQHFNSVPEPSSLLLVTALAGASVLQRRRRHTSLG